MPMSLTDMSDGGVFAQSQHYAEVTLTGSSSLAVLSGSSGHCRNYHRASGQPASDTPSPLALGDRSTRLVKPDRCA